MGINIRSSLHIDLRCLNKDKSSKCTSISFSKKRNLISFNYSLDGQDSFRSSQVKDLGIIFDSKIFFNIHLLSTKKKDISIVWSYKMQSLYFDDPLTLKCLYTSFICPLKYASIIWVTCNIGHYSQIEKLQN